MAVLARIWRIVQRTAMVIVGLRQTSKCKNAVDLSGVFSSLIRPTENDYIGVRLRFFMT